MKAWLLLLLAAGVAGMPSSPSRQLLDKDPVQCNDKHCWCAQLATCPDCKCITCFPTYSLKPDGTGTCMPW